MSDPDAHHAREALAKLDHLVVQEIFLTETCYYADVILPATAWPEKVGTVTNTDRMVQLGRKALEPPGEAKEDLWIIQELARRLGLVVSRGLPRAGGAAHRAGRRLLRRARGGRRATRGHRARGARVDVGLRLALGRTRERGPARS